MQAGEFDHLKGKGQPLRLEPDNPHQAEGEALAHHLLQQNGFSLPWIEMSREIDADLLALHAWLRAERRLAESGLGLAQRAGRVCPARGSPQQAHSRYQFTGACRRFPAAQVEG